MGVSVTQSSRPPNHRAVSGRISRDASGRRVARPDDTPVRAPPLAARLYASPALRRRRDGGGRAADRPRAAHLRSVVGRLAARRAGPALGGMAVRAGRNAVRGVRLARLGRLHLRAAEHPAVRPSGSRPRLRVRDHGGHAARDAPTRAHSPGARDGGRERLGPRRTDSAAVSHRPTRRAGAIVWPLLAWCVLRSGKGDMFAAIWVAVATIEIAGTWAGDWVWAASAPWSHLPSGNPPSAIAAGYAVIDGSVALLAPLVLAVALRARSANFGERPRTALDLGPRSV